MNFNHTVYFCLRHVELDGYLSQHRIKYSFEDYYLEFDFNAFFTNFSNEYIFVIFSREKVINTLIADLTTLYLYL